MTRRNETTLGRLVIWLVLAALGVTMLLPFLWTISNSLKDPGSVETHIHDLLPRDPQSGEISIHWRNYWDVWKDKDVPLGSFYIVSTIVAIFTTLGRVLTSSLAGYAFARLQFPGRDKLFLLYLATLMVPAEVTLIPTFVIIGKLHWMNTFSALIVPGIFTAFGTFMMRQFFLTIPPGLEDAARIDGCGQISIWWRIIMPLSAPALITLSIFTFLGSWNDFLWPLIVTQTKEMMTIPVGLAMLRSDYSSKMAMQLAASIQVTVPVLLIFVFGQRRITEGIVMTGFGGR